MDAWLATLLTFLERMGYDQNILVGYCWESEFFYSFAHKDKANYFSLKFTNVKGKNKVAHKTYVQMGISFTL